MGYARLRSFDPYHAPGVDITTGIPVIKFGQTMEGNLSELIVRNWGALIGLVGIMLIYGAFVEPVRRFVLVIAGSSKVIFILLVVSSTENYLGYGAGTAVMADSLMVVLYVVYLLVSMKRVV